MTLRTGHHVTRAGDLKPDWHHLDASGKTFGRLSSEIATLLIGKLKPEYVSHLLTGDYVVVTNVEKIRVTGNKLEQKRYYRHSGYVGNLKTTTLRDMLEQHPERVIQLAVKGMLPRNHQGRQMLRRLKVYAGGNHPHEAQSGPNTEQQEG